MSTYGDMRSKKGCIFGNLQENSKSQTAIFQDACAKNSPQTRESAQSAILMKSLQTDNDAREI